MNIHTAAQIPSDIVKTKEEFWKEHILLKRKSGQSRSAYCRKYKLSHDQFAYWEQKYNKAVSASKLLPIKLGAVEPVTSNTANEIICTLSLKNGNELKVYNKSVIPLLLSALG